MVSSNPWNIAIEEAQKAVGLTGHNPAVGAVLVKKNKIISAGHTQRPGKDHAEIVAIKKAGSIVRGATLYTTLEPCSYEGKNTPPCTNAIIAAGIKHVIVAIKDPNSLVNGKGIKALKKAGIKVEILAQTSVVAKQAALINQPFFKAMKTGLPYVTLKAGISLDGKIATKKGISKWITSEEARKDARLERSKHDAVLVGSGTVEHDDPELAPHGIYKNKTLLRILIDPELITDVNKKIFRDENVFVATTERASQKRRGLYEEKEIGFEIFGKKEVNIIELLSYLSTARIRSVFVEGGAGVHGSFVDAAQKDARAVDCVLFYIAPKIIGGRDAVSVVGGNGIEDVAHAIECKTIASNSIGTNIKINGMVNLY